MRSRTVNDVGNVLHTPAVLDDALEHAPSSAAVTASEVAVEDFIRVLLMPVNVPRDRVN
jgi:hypothetical protein